MGFPFAHRISDVTPTRDAMQLMGAPLSKTRNEINIESTDMHQIAISVFVKYLHSCLTRLPPFLQLAKRLYTKSAHLSTVFPVYYFDFVLKYLQARAQYSLLTNSKKGVNKKPK